MTINLFSVIVREGPFIWFSLLSTYMAKEEDVLPCGAFGVAWALVTPSSNWVFFSSIFLTKLLSFAFRATFSSLSSFISLDFMFLSKSLS